MAFYIISKYVNKKEINGNDLTDEFFDYVFYGEKDSGEIANKINITKEKLEEIRNEFLYFYPVDSRHSGRDLVPNHLTFFCFKSCCTFSRGKLATRNCCQWFSLNGRKENVKVDGKYYSAKRCGKKTWC